MKVEKVLKKLRRNGYCVSLIDNDQGGWAVAFVRLDISPLPDDTQVGYRGKVLIYASEFRPTIKGAIRAWLRANKIDLKDLE